MANKDQRELLVLINQHLDECCNENILTSLKKKITTQAGRDAVENMVYALCDSEGMSVQSAMSQIDSDLP